jgi:hypothetical protein
MQSKLYHMGFRGKVSRSRTSARIPMSSTPGTWATYGILFQHHIANEQQFGSQ